ncbi:MAG TPA: DegT/DnrJ/EryC1/StrS family aminotransferase [Bacteroidales bacterium]|nr:DegT/DnrJ/EryC1/StrS family aminotransferase [Bacteroidales bacterium]
MPINVFVPKFRTDEILEEIKECLEKGWTGLGFKTVEFENHWKQYTGMPNAHFLSSNTAGLHLALNIFKEQNKWADGDEVISTPLTFISTNHAIVYERLTPVFADVDEYLCLDPKSVLKAITPKTRALIFVGIGGNSGQYEEIVKICKEHNIKLILDAAHMAGTKLNGKHIGSDADVVVYSFQAVKNLPSADSGMICFADQQLDNLARKKSWLGISKDTYQRFNKNEGSYKWKYDVESIGFKYHGNSIMASMGLVQLKYLDEDNTYRRKLASLYDKKLENIKNIQIIKVAPNCESSRHLYQICVPNRDEVMQFFYDNGIYPGVHYIDNTEYTVYNYAYGKCPNASLKSKMLLSLPLHLNLTENDLNLIVSTLEKALKNCVKPNESLISDFSK